MCKLYRRKHCGVELHRLGFHVRYCKTATPERRETPDTNSSDWEEVYALPTKKIGKKK